MLNPTFMNNPIQPKKDVHVKKHIYYNIIEDFGIDAYEYLSWYGPVHSTYE